MNTNQKIIITAIGTLIIGLLLGWIFFGGSEETGNDEHIHDTEISGETIWTCSMHPQIRKNEPGDCPICGMDLIPLEEESGETDPMAINMSPTAMQLANITTAIVGNLEAVKTINLNGKVQEDERLVSSQTSHVAGRIERLAVNFTGEYVNAGQAIAYIYSPELETAQEELLQAYEIKESQPQLYKAAREKLKNWKLTESRINNIVQSGKTMEQFPVLADISGYVIEKLVNTGDYVQRGQPLFEIAKLSKVWVLFDVYESDLAWVNKGDEITFTVASLPGEVFTDKISFIDPVIDPVTRVASARVEVENKDLKLKPEMFASGEVESQISTATDAVVIPKSAVMWTGERSVVYVKSIDKSNISFKLREVLLGPALGESFIIKSGLEKGEEIAVNGTFSIDAAAQLAGKPSMMNPDGGPSMSGHNHGETHKNTSIETVKSDKKITLNTDAKNAVNELINEYLSLKNALVNDNLKETQSAAEAFDFKLSEIKMSVFKGEAHDVWMKHYGSLDKSIDIIKKAKEIEAARIAFIDLSEAIIGLAESFHPFNDKLYIQHCPMANNDKGADWLSLSEEIRNPYFGDKMLKCGSVIKSIDK